MNFEQIAAQRLADAEKVKLLRARMSKLVMLAVAGVFLLILLIWLNPFHTVPTGYRGVITQFGKIVGIQSEGLAVLPPWQRITNFNVRAEETNIDKADGATADTQPVFVSLTVRYSVLPDKVAEVFERYSKTGDLSSYVQTASQEVVKIVTARYTAPELISKRDQVSAAVSKELRQALTIYGAQVIKVDIRNFSFSPEYMAAINQKVTQEQLRMVEENKLRTVEATQKQKVAIAEAEATALKARADGEAYATMAAAKATAESLRVQNAALRENKDVLELRRIEVEQTKAQRWNGELPQSIYAGAPVPFMNIPIGK